jgi:valyl-tRNA synthetase
VAPRERLPVRIQADGEVAAALAAGRDLLANMAGCAEITIARDVQRTRDSATIVVGGVNAFLLGVVDLQRERDKLLAQAQKLRGQIGALEQKLQNPGFVAKAPPAVIAQQRENLAALQQQSAGVEQALRDLG